MSDQAGDTGRASCVPSAACSRDKEGGETVLPGTAQVFSTFLIQDESCPPFRQEFCSAAPFPSVPRLRSRYPFSITRLKGGLL